MLILIDKDSSTRISKEVTPEQAADFAADFPVFVVTDGGDTVAYKDWKASQEPVDAPTDLPPEIVDSQVFEPVVFSDLPKVE